MSTLPAIAGRLPPEFLAAVLIALGLGAGATATAAPGAESPATTGPADALPAGLRCLLAAYPDQLCGATADTLRFCDGTTMAWDDGREKADHAARLADADLQEQLSQPYPAAGPARQPAVDFDPGRLRHEPFFRKRYGGNRRAVSARLATVRWPGGGAFRVTRVGGVDRALRAVADEVARLPVAIRKAAGPSGGGFVWRRIAGTRRLSAHSFGIAVDIAVTRSHYWRWSGADAQGRYRWANRIPMEVVAIFEAHGFIWGGRWYHFDTMHFEYRPELLQAGCRANSG